MQLTCSTGGRRLQRGGSRGTEERDTRRNTWREERKHSQDEGERPCISSIWSAGPKNYTQALELPVDLLSLTVRTGQRGTRRRFSNRFRKSRRVGHISTACFQELGGFLQACLRLNHTNKHSSHQLRRRIVGSHGNKWPPEPGSNLSSCDNSPQFTALVSRPIRGGPLLPGAIR